MRFIQLLFAGILFSNYAIAGRVVSYRGVDDSRERQLCDLNIAYNNNGDIEEIVVTNHLFPSGIAFEGGSRMENNCNVGFAGQTNNSNGGVNLNFRSLINHSENELAGLSVIHDYNGKLSTYNLSLTRKSILPACMAGKVVRPLRSIVTCFGLREI